MLNINMTVLSSSRTLQTLQTPQKRGEQRSEFDSSLFTSLVGGTSTEQAVTQLQPVPASVLPRKCSCAVGGGIRLQMDPTYNPKTAAFLQDLCLQPCSKTELAVWKHCSSCSHHRLPTISHSLYWRRTRQRKGQVSCTKEQHLWPTGAPETNVI